MIYCTVVQKLLVKALHFLGPLPLETNGYLARVNWLTRGVIAQHSYVNVDTSGQLEKGEFWPPLQNLIPRIIRQN